MNLANIMSELCTYQADLSIADKKKCRNKLSSNSSFSSKPNYAFKAKVKLRCYPTKSTTLLISQQYFDKLQLQRMNRLEHLYEEK